MTTYDIESFVSLWGFLNKRFFLHLDAEHAQLSAQLKSDLIKFYLVYSIKCKNKDKVGEFFNMYSHEILADNGNYIPGNLRGWFVLPFMDDPDKDHEFAVYFSSRWAELLKITLHNFLSVVFSTAPPPKLLVLQKWYRSEAQQEIRSQLRLSAHKIDALVDRIEKYEIRLQSMREVVKNLVGYVHKVNISGNSLTSRAGQALFDTTTDEADTENKQERSRDLGQLLMKVSTECARRNAQLSNATPALRQKEILGAEFNALSVTDSQVISNRSPRELEEMESELVHKVGAWLALLSSR